MPNDKLRERGVVVMNGALVTSYDGSVVKLNNGTSISAATLIWTAGAKPSPVIDKLTMRETTRPDSAWMNASLSQEFLAYGQSGDCAAVPDGAGKFYPPTAQHGMREAVVAAKNIARAIAGEPLKPFRYKTIGMLASLGHHTWRSHAFRDEVLRLRRLVDVAQRLSGKASTTGQEAPRRGGLDAGPFLRARDRADDYRARHRSYGGANSPRSCAQKHHIAQPATRGVRA